MAIRAKVVEVDRFCRYLLTEFVYDPGSRTLALPKPMSPLTLPRFVLWTVSARGCWEWDSSHGTMAQVTDRIRTSILVTV